MALDPDRYRLSEQEHEAIFRRIVLPSITDRKQAAEFPVAVIFGGQPGAGKSAAVDQAVQELSKTAKPVQIIGDDFRAFHPRFHDLLQTDDKTAAFYTDRDTGRWVEKAITHVKEQRYNVVIEGTMRNPDVVAQTMQSFRDAGYQIDARALAVNERFSWQGVLDRYEKQKAVRGDGRMTTPEAHAAGYNGLPLTLERIEADKLADHITLYRRGAVPIYRNELHNGQWQNVPGAVQALNAERNRPFTPDEQRAYLEGFDRIRALIAAPNRRASPEEIKSIDTLRQQAFDGMSPYLQGRLAAQFHAALPQSTKQNAPQLAADRQLGTGTPVAKSDLKGPSAVQAPSASPNTPTKGRSR